MTGILVLFLLVAGLPLPGAAGEPASDLETAREARVAQLDAILLDAWQQAGVTPATEASDAEFLRRVYLDLTGRIPRVSEVREFLAEARADKRAQLIDRLVAKPDHSTHLANLWRGVLLPDNAGQVFNGGEAPFQAWLRGQLADNVAYDRIVRELLVAKGQVGQAGPTYFYTSLQNKPEELAASTSRAFLGVQIQCAQCHDHPFEAWKQEDFWGYAAFFARVGPPPNGNMAFVFQVMDTNEGEVKHPKSGEAMPPRFLGAREAAALPSGQTRREHLAAWVAARENPYFARAAVNRVWGMLFGEGIVHPVDDMGDHNPPRNAALLDALAAQFVATGFDLRELFRTITRTRAYQLSSAGHAGAAEQLQQFARMAIKPLTADQLYDCLATATARRAPQNYGYNPQFALYDPMRIAFAAKFRVPPGQMAEYQGGIPQALTLMNGGLVADATHVEKSDLLAALTAPFFSDEQRVETLFLSTLSRQPSEGERQKCVSYVASRASPEERRAALADILWALLNTAEFTLNH